ncbi:MAG: acetyltransferase [Caldilineaceae bacterium]
MRKRCIILGGGGHARVLIDCIHNMGDCQIHGILDPNQQLWGQLILDVRVLGGDELLAELANQQVNCFAVGVGGVGNNRPRQQLFELGLAHGLSPLLVKHSSALCSQWAEIGEGAQLLVNCIVNAGAKLGDNVLVNSGAIIEHDCVVDDHVHIATGAKLASTVSVGKGVHIGAGATVKQCVTIGNYAVVGAGAVVVHDVAPHTVVVGVPARPLIKQANSTLYSKEVID